MEKEINALATLDRYHELIVAEREAQLLKAFLKKKKEHYSPISFDEVKMLHDMFCNDASGEEK